MAFYLKFQSNIVNIEHVNELEKKQTKNSDYFFSIQFRLGSCK